METYDRESSIRALGVNVGRYYCFIREQRDDVSVVDPSRGFHATRLPFQDFLTLVECVRLNDRLDTKKRI